MDRQSYGHNVVPFPVPNQNMKLLGSSVQSIPFNASLAGQQQQHYGGGMPTPGNAAMQFGMRSTVADIGISHAAAVRNFTPGIMGGQNPYQLQQQIPHQQQQQQQQILQQQTHQQYMPNPHQQQLQYQQQQQQHPQQIYQTYSQNPSSHSIPVQKQQHASSSSQPPLLAHHQQQIYQQQALLSQQHQFSTLSQQQPQTPQPTPQQQPHQQQQQQQQQVGFGQQQVRFGQQASLLTPVRPSQVSTNIPAAIVAAASPVSRKTLACLALADHALKSNQIMLGFRCLHGALVAKDMPARLTAQTCLNIAKISWRYLRNAQYAKSAVQEALKIIQSNVRQSTSLTQSSFGPVLELEATLLLCRILISERAYSRALQQLNAALDTAKSVASVAHANNPQWYCQIKSLQIITMLKAGDRTAAEEAIKVVCDYCTHNNLFYLKVLFTLARAQFCVQFKRYQDALLVVQECQTLLNTPITAAGSVAAASIHPILREELRCYGHMLTFLVYLSYGKLKGGKPFMDQMEKHVNDLEELKKLPSSAETGGQLVRRYSEAFQFIDDDLYLPLYFAVVAQYHLKNGFASHTDRYAAEAVQRFCPSTLALLTAPAAASLAATTPRDKSSSSLALLAPFRTAGTAVDWNEKNSNGFDLRIHLHSLLVSARLMLSRTSSALDDVAAIIRYAQRNVYAGVNAAAGGGASATQSSLIVPMSDDMQARVHCMLAMIAMSLNFNAAAESQLNAALRTCTDHEWWLYMSLTMAIVYLRHPKFQDFVTLARSRLLPEMVSSHCLLLRNCVNAIQSSLAFLENRYDDSRVFLTEGVTKTANEESITRMSAVSLCQLGWYAHQLNNRDEALQMANASYGMATKFPDLGLQYWALVLMRNVFVHVGDGAQAKQCSEYIETLSNFVNEEYVSLQRHPEHLLLDWVDGPAPLSAQQQQQ